MTNGTKLLIGILAIAAIVIGVTTAMKTEDTKQNSNRLKNNTSDMLQYMENAGKNENKKNQVTENEVVTENKVSEEVRNEVKNEVVGKEEIESKEENVGLSNEQKAIKLAQDEWAISINSYKFEAELQDNGTYIVKVINKTDTRENARYVIDVEKESVTEI